MELSLPLPSGAARLGITGPQQRNLKLLREALGVALHERGDVLRVCGEAHEVGLAIFVLEQLTEAARRNKPFTRTQVVDTLAAASARPDIRRVHSQRAGHLNPSALETYLPGRTIRPASDGQRAYLASVLSKDLTFCTGPAGCGKTFLAVAAAVAMLRRGVVRKIILTRPAVEAGEKIGFLPGTLQEKVNPYLRPLLDALNDMMPFEQVERFMASDVIEIAPLGFMRGRTLNEACVILDEAQNTSRAQMLMFLTRLGHDAKMVVTGDPRQVDLPNPRESGLVDAVDRLAKVRDIGIHSLDAKDIVRHGLVQKVLDAYGDAADGAHPAKKRVKKTAAPNGAADAFPDSFNAAP